MNLVKSYFLQRKNKWNVSAAELGVIILLLGMIVAMLLLYPLYQIFQGNWILNQSFDLLKLENVKLGDFLLPPVIINIRYYAICILLAALSGYFLALFLAKKQMLSTTVVDRLFIGLVVFGLLGARIFFVLFNWEYFQRDLASIFYIFNGGIAFYGMLVFGGIYLWLYCNKYKFNFFEILDIATPAVLLGQTIGRFGNFFNYEAYGEPTSAFWKMFVPETAINKNGYLYTQTEGNYFHPTFLYEIIPNFLLLVTLLFVYKNLTNKRSGLVTSLYCIGYGIIRFFTEFFRLDALRITLPSVIRIPVIDMSVQILYISQISSLLLILLGLVIFFLRRKVIYLKKNMQEVRVA
jgi:phosphatidylglycerol:prolipoprotein diacylglycerol transferase